MEALFLAVTDSYPVSKLPVSHDDEKKSTSCISLHFQAYISTSPPFVGASQHLCEVGRAGGVILPEEGSTKDRVVDEQWSQTPGLHLPVPFCLLLLSAGVLLR